MTTLLLGAVPAARAGSAWLYQTPKPSHIVQACGQIVVAARRNGEKAGGAGFFRLPISRWPCPPQLL